MDPNACYDALIESIGSEDWAEAIEHARNLWSWIARDGRLPDRGLIAASIPSPFEAPGLGHFIKGINRRLTIKPQFWRWLRPLMALSTISEHRVLSGEAKPLPGGTGLIVLGRASRGRRLVRASYHGADWYAWVDCDDLVSENPFPND